MSETATKERTVTEMLDFGINHLPDGWELHLTFLGGEVSWTLLNPDEEEVEVCTLDCCVSPATDWTAFVAHVNAAREAEGLSLTPID